MSTTATPARRYASPRVHARKYAAPRLIGRIGANVDIKTAALQCVKFAERNGAVMVTVDAQRNCWALLPGSRYALKAMSKDQPSVLCTWTASAPDLLEDIEKEMVFRIRGLA